MPARALNTSAPPGERAPDPLDVLCAWPTDWPLACTWSSPAHPDHPASTEPCWTILARAGDAAFPNTLDELESVLARRAFVRSPADTSPCSGWIGSISYNLGRQIEPASAAAAETPAPGNTTPWADDRPWPTIALRRINSALMFDRSSCTWWAIDDERGELESLLRRVTRTTLERADTRPAPSHRNISTQGYTLAPPNTDANRTAYIRGVETILSHLAAGNAYQVNLAHRLSCDFRGSARALFAALAHTARPRHGAYLEAQTPRARLAIASASPELFLRYDPVSRTLLTRPMKGTRPGDTGAGELLASEKDRAELTMITDLVRNDLGRVAVTGSVRVLSERTIEHHGAPAAETRAAAQTTPSASASVLQATSTIACTVRPGLGLADVLRATFPPGSVTGAPKVSAMRIIESLEPARRGPYCGTIGFFGDDGGLNLGVAIRSACISAAVIRGMPELGAGAFDRAILDYWVGAGVVADSVAQSEWEETLVKARTLRAVLSPPAL